MDCTGLRWIALDCFGFHSIALDSVGVCWIALFSLVNLIEYSLVCLIHFNLV